MVDFRYEHGAGTCQEMIPWNASTMQVDVDLWCSYPEAQTCRNYKCDAPLVGCDNMDTYVFSGLGVLEGCTGASDSAIDVLHEICTWTCKHRRPVARCWLHFDPFGALGMQDNLEACWLEEVCQGQSASVLNATCKPKAAKPLVKVEGTLRFFVPEASSFIAQDDMAAALKSAIATALATQSVASSDVVIESLTPQRRLTEATQERLRGLQALQAVTVRYGIHLADGTSGSAVERALRTEMALRATDASLLVSVINGELSSRGLSGVIQTAELTVAPLATVDLQAAETGQAMQEELAALFVTHKVYREHLDEALAELEATNEDLAAEDLPQAERQVVEGMQMAAQKRLSQLLDRHENVQQLLESAMAKHNATSGAVSAAVAEVTSSAKRLEAAESSATATQAQLEQLRTKHMAAEQHLLWALGNHTEAEKKLRLSRAEHEKTAASLSEVSQELATVRQLLHKTEKDQKMTFEELQAQINQTKLFNESWQKEKKAREESQAAHQRTANELESVKQESGNTLLLVVAIMGAVILCLCLALVGLFCYKRRSAKSPIMELQEYGESVVVGRPVAPTENADDPKASAQASDLKQSQGDAGTRPRQVLVGTVVDAVRLPEPEPVDQGNASSPQYVRLPEPEPVDQGNASSPQYVTLPEPEPVDQGNASSPQYGDEAALEHGGETDEVVAAERPEGTS
eukprot:TRINITY_DN13028_c0_g1_i3.p1 TRINITY_DN13028_c0_g1~~TRINITY_DN13028_c0_g1_i3.p1  ORF type:complete len:752 (-),score=180.69 TRINITY_DN13028_c0_g1_i3:66-2138(-)